MRRAVSLAATQMRDEDTTRSEGLWQFPCIGPIKFNSKSFLININFIVSVSRNFKTR